MVKFVIGGCGMDDSFNLKNIDFFEFETLDSTNDFLLKQKPSNKIQVCLAKEQTKGRGQFNRQWSAEKNSSILCSIKRKFDTKSLNGLSLVIGLSIVKTLEKQYQIKDLKLKWPNDIYFKHQKLAGILLENTFFNNKNTVVIGFGLNIDNDFSSELTAINLKQITSKPLQIENLTKQLIKQILLDCAIFEKKGFSNFLNEWQQYDYLKGQTKTIQNQIGIVQGVNEEGALIMNVKGENCVFYTA